MLTPLHGVKICGLTTRADRIRAEVAGADFVGAILAGGPRHLDLDRAREVFSDGDDAGPDAASLATRRAKRVAVVGAEAPARLADIAASVGVDILQLHGDPSAIDVRELSARSHAQLWPVLRIDGTRLPPNASELAEAAGWLVLDAKVTGQLGGTGVALDWHSLADDVAALRRFVPGVRLVLAGGLRPDNVARAIALLAPDVVDVSSGVEQSVGTKDPLKIEAFVHNARAAWNSGEDDAR